MTTQWERDWGTGAERDPSAFYAQVVSCEPGECFRWVHRRGGAGRPERCPEPVVVAGWIGIGDRRRRTESCEHHRAGLLEEIPPAPPLSGP